MNAEMMPDETTQEETDAEIEADDARWDALLATEAAQLLLERLAEEALIEYRVGQTREKCDRKPSFWQTNSVWS